jgi:hypothetical protein
MEYLTAILVPAILLLCTVIYIAYYAGKNSMYKVLHDARMEGYQDGWQSARKSMDEVGRYNKSVDEAYREGLATGYADAKKIYYDDPRAERLIEESRIRAELMEENKHTNIAAELMMAYGVTNVSQLPKSVREAYNLTTDDSVDLEKILTREVDDDGRY